jgi:Cu/Ag efflux protein CusF
MKKIAIALAAALLTSGAALAATDTGTIKQIDPKSDAVTLDDGKTFTLAEGTEAESLKVGQTITVTYHVKSGKMVATKVTAGQ